MTTLASYSSNLVGFFSYSREDDADFDDVLSKFRVAIQAELSAQLGRNRDNFRIWQDKFAIPHGALWQQQITDGIKQSTFYIPIITPRVVNSPHCAFEFNSFLAREKELGRDDLVFPISLHISSRTRWDMARKSCAENRPGTTVSRLAGLSPPPA